jgi:two-component system alkaline phosphatase synthesis response regulator PhoP
LATILIVDDAPYVRALLLETLEELEDEGHDLLTAGDGAAGWELVKAKRPALVLLDVMMPKMNGYEVCQRIKQDPALSDAYVILLTAKGQEVDRDRGWEAGADDYVTKPFDPDNLVERARQVLQHH